MKRLSWIKTAEDQRCAWDDSYFVILTRKWPHEWEMKFVHGGFNACTKHRTLAQAKANAAAIVAYTQGKLSMQELLARDTAAA